MDLESVTIASDESDIPQATSPAEVENQPAAPDGSTAPNDSAEDFGDLFDRARAAADKSSKLAEQDSTEPELDQPSEVEPETDTESGEEESVAANDEDDRDQQEKGEEPEESEKAQKKPSRVESFKAIKQRAETAEQRVTQLNEKLEKYGGIESVEDMTNFFETAMNPAKADDFVEELRGLPHGGEIQRKIFDGNLKIPANRVYAVNSVLKSDFGLEKNLPDETLVKVFEYVAAKANSDIEELNNSLDVELSYLDLDDDESEIEKLKRENELLKNPPPAEPESNQRDFSKPETQLEIGRKAQTAFAEFENRTIDEIAAPLLQQIGFAPAKTDAPDIKAAKQALSSMVTWAVIGETAQSEARTNVASLFVQREITGGESAESEADSVYARSAQRQFRNLVKLKTQSVIKNISALLGKHSATQGATGTETSRSAALEAATGKAHSSIAARPRQAISASFDELFEEARTDRR